LWSDEVFVEKKYIAHYNIYYIVRMTMH